MLIRLSILFLIAVLSVSTVAESKPSDSQQILSVNERGLTIVFTVKTWSRDTVVVVGQPKLRLGFPQAIYSGKIGHPQIPYHVAMVGIPLGAAVRYRLLEVEEIVEPDVALLSFPVYKKSEGQPVQEYQQNPVIYQNSSPYPKEQVTVDRPVWFRDQQIVRIEVAAVHYRPGARELVKYHRIVLRLDFDGTVPVASERHFSSSAEESLYKNLLLNYEQAAKWRKTGTRKTRLGKRSAPESMFYVFKVQEEGIYKIDGKFLESKISGLDLDSIDPERIRLYNNGGRELPRNLLHNRPDGLVENAIVVNDGGDGRFDRNDSILFYARGVEGWNYETGAVEFNHYINHYGSDNLYWLTLDGMQQGKRMESITSGQTQPAVTEKNLGMYFLEEENRNPLNSGLNWFGHNFTTDAFDRSHTWNISLPNVIAGDDAWFNFRFMALNERTHRFDIAINGVPDTTYQFSGRSGDYITMIISDFTYRRNTVLSSGNNSVQLKYSHTNSTGQAFLDWMEIFYTAGMKAVDDELFFTVVPAGGPESYRISGINDNQTSVFDVTNYADVKKITGAGFTNNAITFTIAGDAAVPRRFAAVAPARYKTVSGLERMTFTDLRSTDLAAEFIIITHDDFESEASRLESHRENGSTTNRLTTVTVKISDVYNNFSAGMVDPGAIREFLKYAYDNWTPKPLYVLLLGDGDFDPKNKIVRSDRNWIPTFQSDAVGDDGASSISELVSRTTDSWFTYLTPDDYRSAQNRNPRPIMDVAIGRLNVQTIEEAQNVIDKIIAYESQPLRGNWRNVIIMAGDDELVGGGRATAADVVHIQQTEEIAETIIPDSYDIKKIYLSEFPKIISASSGGVAKPAAKEALIRQINLGTLIVNYIGHGNSTLWAHEHLFDQSDNIRIQNQNKLIFFMAATCDWALFDDPRSQSQAEELLQIKDRGAIAMVSSTRLVFSHTNFSFNKAYYRQLFNSSGPTNRIGDAFIQARAINRSTVNDEKYHVYGDPTLRLAVPELEAEITSLSPDSILALSTMQVEGQVSQNGQLQTDFNGTALVTVFDSKKKVVHLTETGINQTYFLPGNSIYRGTVPVENGQFNARFVVPKDLSYGGKLARVSTYFWNEAGDGVGFRKNILVSSTSSNLVDADGPDIDIFFKEHPNFISGDLVRDNITMVVELADTISGINIAGEIGHRLTLSIDPNEETCLSQLNRFNGISTIDLTDLFSFNEGDHLRGKIELPLTFPEKVEIGGTTVSCKEIGGEQKHTLVVKAWDNSNNSATVSLEVRIDHNDHLEVREVMNYPNPFKDKTTFTFNLNQDDVDVIIKIYTISGQLIKTVEYHDAFFGFNMVPWDGLDEHGDIPANGVYLYKLIARSLNGAALSQDEEIGRLAIIR